MTVIPGLAHKLILRSPVRFSEPFAYMHALRHPADELQLPKCRFAMEKKGKRKNFRGAHQNSPLRN